MGVQVGRRGAFVGLIFALLPAAVFAWFMFRHHWIMPVAVDAPDRPVPAAVLVTAFWVAVLVYNMYQRPYYGIRSAIFMDVTTRRVAATQFTAYMALSNFAISYSARWQGWSIERWGHPTTLGLDALLGLVCLLCLPFMGKVREHGREPVGAAVPEGIQP